MPHASKVIIPENSHISEMKYAIIAIIRRRMVSVIAEWVRNLKYLKARLLKTPKPNPKDNDAAANAKKFSIIRNGVAVVNSVVLSYCTVLNRMMLTISLNTPSPYTIENSLG